jgi:YVTN family beta-propeller protein
MPPLTSRSPRSLPLTAGLFALTLGAYFPLWAVRVATELSRAARDARVPAPGAVALLVLAPVLNIAGLAYLAVALPRALRRAANGAADANTEVVSALMIAAVAGGIGLALLLDVSPLLGGYLAWPLELPAALLVQRQLNRLTTESPAATDDAGGARPRRDPETVAALALAFVVLASGGIALAFSGEGDDTSSSGPLSAQAPRPVASDIAVSPQAVWQTRLEDDVVRRVDKETLQPIGSPIKVGREPLDVVYGFGSIWVANRTSSTVTRIDPATARVIGRPLAVGRAPWGLAIGDSRVWVSNQVERTASSIDPDRGQVRLKAGAAGIGPRGIAVGEGAVWVANFDGSSLSRIDPDTGASREIAIGGSAQDVAAAYGAVWVTRPSDGQVSVLRPDGRRVGTPIQVGALPSSIVAGLGYVWVANSSSGTVARIDPRTRRVVGRPLAFDQGISDMTIADRRLWVLQGDGTVRRTRIAPR